MTAKSLPFLLAAILALLPGAAKAAEVPVFAIKPAEVANIVLNADPGDPWIFSITLTEKKLKEYHAFTVAHMDDEISLVVAGTELYRPLIRAAVSENPLTFRMYEKDKFLAILAALPADPQ